MKKLLISARGCTSGATAIEYALIAGAIALVIIASVAGVGVSLSSVFTVAAAGL